MKNKDKKQHQGRTMPENGWEKTPYNPKITQFLKGGRNSHFGKAKWSQMVYTKNKQKLPFKAIRVVLCRKLHKNTLNIRKMTRRLKVAKLAISQGS